MEEERIIKRIFSNHSFEEVKKECDQKYHLSTCRTIFGNTQEIIYYRCKTCQMTWDAAICSECFKNGNHKNHEWFMQKSVKIGMCDCGKKNRWKRDGNCKCHREYCDGNCYDLLPEYLRQNFVNEITNILKQLKENVELLKINKGKFFKKSEIFYNQTEIMKYVNIIRKIGEIDMLFEIIVDIMRSNDMIEHIVKWCFGDDEIVTNGIDHLLIMITADSTVFEDIYLLFINHYFTLYNNHELLRKVNGEMISALSRQILSEKELNEKYFFGNDNDFVSKSFQLIKTYIQQITSFITDEDFVLKMDCFVQQFCSVVLLSIDLFIDNKKYLNELISLLEILTFFNMETRMTKDNNDYDGEIDTKIRYLSDEIITVSYRCIERLKQMKNMKEIKELIYEMSSKYQELITIHIHSNRNEIDVGKNQAIGMYYNLGTVIVYALSKIDNPKEILKEIDPEHKMILYPLIYQQFLAEMNYNQKIWLRNAITAVNKAMTIFTQYSDQMMNDLYLFQLSVDNSDVLLNQMKTICKLTLLEQMTSTTKIDSTLKDQIKVGIIASLRLIYNIVVDPIYSCKLPTEDIVRYIMMHVLYEEKNSINKLFAKIPTISMRLINFCGEIIIKDMIEITNNQYHLKEKYKKYINPYSFYISSLSSEAIKTKFEHEYRYSKMEIYMGERRSKETTASLVNFIHNEEISKILLLILQKATLTNTEKNDQRIDQRILMFIVQILRLRVYYPPYIKYTEEHLEIIEEIGNEIEEKDIDGIIFTELKNMKEHELLMKSTVVKGITKHMGKGINGIERSDEKKKQQEQQKKKQMKIKKQMIEKQQRILDKEDTNEKDNSLHSEQCIICQQNETSLNKPNGYLCHIEMSDAIRIQKIYERNEKIKGNVINGKWIKPQSIERNTWEHEERKENDCYRILSFCPHKMHYQCYKSQYEYQINEENYYLKNTIYCPLCGTLSTIFIEEQPTQFLSSNEYSFTFTSNKISHEKQIETIEEIKKRIEMRKETISELSESEERTIENTLTRTIREETITKSLYEMAFESIMNIIVSTIMTIELESRTGQLHHYEEFIHVINSYLTVAKKIKERISKEKRIEMIEQILQYDNEINEKND